MGGVTEDVVWCEYLRAEQRKLALPSLQTESARLTEAPDFADTAANARRKGLLSQIRGGTVDCIPLDAVWTEVQFGPSDARLLFTPRFDVWMAASDGTFRLEVVAKNLCDPRWTSSDEVTAGIKMNSLVLEMELASLRHEMTRIAQTEPDGAHPIAVSLPLSEKITVIHGIARLAARMASSRSDFQSIAYLGTSPRMSSCSWLNV